MERHASAQWSRVSEKPWSSEISFGGAFARSAAPNYFPDFATKDARPMSSFESGNRRTRPPSPISGLNSPD
jgi:hypothetical protein